MWLRKGGRRIGLEDFDAALELISQKKGMRLEDVWSQVRPWKTYVVIQFCKEHLLRVGPNLLQPCFFFLLFFLFDRCCGGPVLTSTKAETVRFYDDKSTYTGTHAQGGPDPGRKGRGTGLSRPQWGCQTEAKVELSIETIETMTLLFLDVFLLGFTDHGFTPLVLEPFLLKQFCWKKSRTWSATTPSSQGVTNSPRDFETIMSLPSALTSVGSVDDRRGTGRVGSLSEKKIAQQLRGKDGTVEDQQLRFNMLRKHGSNEKCWLVVINIVCFAICRGL